MGSCLVEKFFSTAGSVKSDLNYIVDPLRRVDYEEIAFLIRQHRYFVLHAPRQTGKITSLLAMVKRINYDGIYRCLYMNVESAQTARNDVAEGMKAIISSFLNAACRFIENPPRIDPIQSIIEETGGHS